MDMIEDLLKRIYAHCEKRKIAPSTFGRLAINDGKLVERLESGKTITLATLDRVNAALAERAD